MGTMTLADFRDEVLFHCGGISATSPALTTARLDRRINATYLWVSMPNHYRHPELESVEKVLLVANTSRYTPSKPNMYMISGVVHAEAVPASVTDITRRTKLRPVDIRDQMTVARQPGKPAYYAYWNSRIYLNCTPATEYQGQTLEVYGYFQPSILTAVGQATVLKPEWDEVITIGAEWRTWVSLGEADRAYEAKENFGQLVNEIADVRRLHGEEWDWQTSGGPQTYMRSS